MSFFSHTETKLGAHNQAIRCIQGNPVHNMVLTGSWDSTVKLWDPRDPQGVTTLHVPDKVRLFRKPL